MKPPTKFELMRTNRELGELRAAAVEFREDMTQAGCNTLTQYKACLKASEPVSSIVPTMEINGVRYREAPSEGFDGCSGCARKSVAGMTCALMEVHARPAFGGDCADRGVIYIRAE